MNNKLNLFYISNSTKKISIKHMAMDSVLLALAAASIYIASAVKIYYGNPLDFIFPLSDLNFVAGLWGLYLLIAIAALLFTSRWLPLYCHVTNLLFVVIVGLWAQANLFNWNYGLLDGTSIAWNNFANEGIIEIIFLIVLLLVALVFEKQIYSIMPYVLVTLILMQGGDAWVNSSKTTSPDIDKVFVIDDSNKFVFGKKDNVIIVVLDAFQGSIFDEILVDSPEHAKALHGFTWFKNASCAIASTTLSLPHLLTSVPYDNTIPVHQYKQQVSLGHSLPLSLKAQGYKTEYYPEAGYGVLPVDDRLWTNVELKTGFEQVDEYNKLIQATNFRVSPQAVKKQLYYEGAWSTLDSIKRYLITTLSNGVEQPYLNTQPIPVHNPKQSSQCCNNIPAGVNKDVDFTNAMLGQVRKGRENKVFKLYHLQGLHPPRHIDQNFNVVRSMNSDPSTLLSSGRASLKLLELFLGELKKAGAYDNSLIFIIADHGSDRIVKQQSASVHSEDLNSKTLRWTFDFLKSRAIPLVLVKPAGATGPMQVSGKPVSLGDIPNTASELIGGKPNFPGVSMFSNIELSRERLHWSPSYAETHYDYYGDLQEFSIKGDIYDDAAWSVRGKLKRPVKTGLSQVYDERKAYLKAMLPLKAVLDKGQPFATPTFAACNGDCDAPRAFDRMLPNRSGWQPVVSPGGNCASQSILGINFDRPLLLKAYSIKTRPDIEYMAPNNWILEASSDEENWFPLHQVTGEIGWEHGGKVNVYQLEENYQSFSSYRLNITEPGNNRCIFIDEFELFE